MKDNKRKELETKLAGSMEELANTIYSQIVDEFELDVLDPMQPTPEGVRAAEEIPKLTADLLTALVANARARVPMSIGSYAEWSVAEKGRIDERLMEFDVVAEMEKAAKVTWCHFLTLRNLTELGTLDNEGDAAFLNSIAFEIWGRSGCRGRTEIGESDPA